MDMRLHGGPGLQVFKLSLSSMLLVIVVEVITQNTKKNVRISEEMMMTW